MDNKEKFTARIYHYIGNEIHLVVKKFDRLEDAVEAGIKAACHSYKVYDENGSICHNSQDHHGHDTYA